MNVGDIIPAVLFFIGGVFAGLAGAQVRAAWRRRAELRRVDERTWEERACRWHLLQANAERRVGRNGGGR